MSSPAAESVPATADAALVGSGPPLEDLLRRLLVADGLTDAAQAAVDAVRRCLDIDISWCGVVTGDYLTMAAHSGIRTAQMMALWRLRVGQGVGGRVVTERRVLSVRDYRRDPRRVPVMKSMIDSEGVHSAICAPLLIHDEAVGVIYAAHRQAREWSRADSDLLTRIGRDTATCLALLRERRGEQDAAADAHRRAEATDRVVDGALDTAAAVLAGEDMGAGLQVLAHRLGQRVELLGPARDVLRTAPDTPSGDEPVLLETGLGDDALGTLRVRGTRELTSAQQQLVALSASMIGLQLMRLRAGLLAEGRLYGGLLDDLLTGRDSDSARIRERAMLLGMDLATPRHVVCIGPVAAPEQSPFEGGGSARVESSLRACYPASIFARRPEGLLVLLDPGGGTLQEVHESLGRLLRAVEPPAAAGLGRLCVGPSDYADSYDEAVLGLEVARRRRKPGEVVPAADLGFYGLLARGTGRGSLETMVEQALGPLIDADAQSGSDYVRTLDAYLSCDRHLERTAACLHVHPNTVRYRIAKAQEKLGVDLHDVENRFLLELALRVQAALGDPEPGGG
ncbi:MAG TPA: helix-turn-helix domain-containing protein [Sporichthyaceae bacterium]|nr:helix-turn-helix domain-containing protein [Sporichthyaceae bacterium]